MTQTHNQGPVVPVNPQPNVYTVLLIIAIVAMAAAAIFGVHDLTSNYGISFGDLFQYTPIKQ